MDVFMQITNPNHFPLYFEAPNHEELKEKAASLSPEERKTLEGNVYTLARQEGVPIAEWDSEWGKYHLFDSENRLTRAFLHCLKVTVQRQAQCPQEIVDLIVECSPLVNDIHWNQGKCTELAVRAECLSHLNDLKKQLSAKYPDLNLLSENSTPRTRGWKAQETFLLTLPVFLSRKEEHRFDYFCSVIQELINGKYDTQSAELILDKFLERESRRPSAPHLESHIRLLDLKKIAESQINGTGLNRANESLYKDIFIVPHGEDKQAKFKPLHPCEATKEVYAYNCDRMLGIGMTAPTMLLKTKNLAANVETLRKLFHSATLCGNRTVIIDEHTTGCIPGKDTTGAKWLREKAFSLFNSCSIPQGVRNSIYEQMFHLCGNSQEVDQLGELLFFGKPGFETTDKHRECAIHNYMQLQTFKDHLSKFSSTGSIQLWLNDCGRAYDYIVKDENGGAKLKTAPKTLAHFTALLGMLKASMDCSSGNNLIQFDNSKGEIINFWDMDDERSMCTRNEFWQIRLWQMGLPQCAQPFDRAFLLLFADPTLLEKLKQIQSFAHIPDAAYLAQIERLSKMIALFKVELDKDSVELTPRDLFFHLFGGREDFNLIKKRFNEDQSFGPEGIRISPIELFEFHLPEMGRGAWYTGDGHEQWVVGQNMRTLYAPELP